MLTPEQRAARTGGVGGSDAGIIAGLAPWMTNVQLWQQKTGRVPEPDLSDNELVEFGSEFEDVIGRVWARRTENKIRRINRTLVHKEHPWMLAHIDFDVVGKNEGLECKQANWFMRDLWGEEESDDVPLYYLTQGVHYMAVYDTEAWNFAVLLGGNTLRRYRVTRDMDAEKQLIELERKFWEHVKTDTPPPPMKVSDLVRLWPNTEGAIEATEEIALAVGNYKQLKIEVKEREKKLDALKLEIGTFMGPHDALVDPFDSATMIATYKSNSVTRIDSKRLKEEQPAIAESYSKTSQERKFLPK